MTDASDFRPQPLDEAPAGNDVRIEQFLASIDPAAWARIRWVRGQLADCDRVLLLGRRTAALAVVLMREGHLVSAIETDPEWLQSFEAVLDHEGLSAGDSAVVPPSAQALADAFERLRPDAVAILDEHAGEADALFRLLGDDGACTSMSRLVAVLPFGVAEGAAPPALPRSLIGGLRPGVTAAVEILEGHLHMVAGVGIGRLLELPDLLALTEQGSVEVIGRESGRRAVAERELHDTRESLQEAEKLIDELHASTSFRLGQALVMAVRSPRAALTLPWAVVQVLRGRRARGAGVEPGSAPARTGLSEWEKEQLRSAARQAMPAGADAVVEAMRAELPDAPQSVLAFACLVAAQACGAAERHDLEFEIASRALEMNRSVGMLRGFLHVALRCRQMQAASATLAELHAAAESGNRIAAKFIDGFKETSSYKIAVLEAIPPRPEHIAGCTGGRLVYVLHNSLPYSSGGYATRSHGVSTALTAQGVPVVCVTRPGFPLDMKPELAPVDVAAVDLIDAVPYQRVSEPRRINRPEYQYVLAAADRMEGELARLDASYVMAASNYVTGLPALIAARRLGLPFFYEVRGLWEITRMSRDDEFAKSISFDVQRHLEATLAREADHVFTLTQPMREELIERGVEPARITLLPNSVDADRFLPTRRDDALARELGVPESVPVIGYVGTFVIYEGLEHLAQACVALHRKGHDFRLLLVGNENASGQDRGPITQEVLDICTRGGIADKLIMPGRIPHEQVGAYYSLIDVCPFPRKPWPVCEMVSPMKPLEALAMEKAVVVSSVRALTEMIQDGITGVVFEKGNTDSLTDAIEGLLQAPQRRAALGRAGREFVARERSWAQVADRIQTVKGRFDAQRDASRADGAGIEAAARPLAARSPAAE